jgi:hypothetical protein
MAKTAGTLLKAPDRRHILRIVFLANSEDLGQVEPLCLLRQRSIKQLDVTVFFTWDLPCRRLGLLVGACLPAAIKFCGSLRVVIHPLHYFGGVFIWDYLLSVFQPALSCVQLHYVPL